MLLSPRKNRLTSLFKEVRVFKGTDPEPPKVSRTLKSTEIRGVPKSEFSGSQKGGIKGEVKRGDVMGEGTRPEGEREGKTEGKRVGGKGPETALEKL